MLRLIALVLIVHDATSAFFDPTDIEDPLALFWNTKVQDQDQCRAYDTDGTARTGVCKHRTHCYLSGGKALGQGRCGILSTCCVHERSCSKRTSAKVSYFESDQLEVNRHSRCSYTVDLESPHICQVRLDFKKFRLSPATFQAGRGYRCDRDSFTVTPHTYNIPTLCGYNDNQHVYVHLDSTQKQVVLDVHLANRDVIGQAIGNPSWQIKVTQLECTGPDLYSIKKHFDPRNDYELLAPRGAIQYFIQPSGIIRSFGFDPNQKINSYTSSLGYGIAFKQFPDLCGVRFTTNYLNIYDDAVTIGDCEDYLYVPELEYLSPLNGPAPQPKICSATEAFYTKLPGPLKIHFVSKSGQTEMITTPWAFDITYNFDVCTTQIIP